MNDLLTTLLKLQALEFGEIKENDAETQMAELRARVPQPILGHYERLVARGKKGVAVVRNQVCTGCHMRLPIGTINTLMQGQDVQLCDTCGRYLYLPAPAENQFVENVAAAKPAAKPTPKPRKKKTPTPAPAAA
ncbi:MAG TPA: C4-type zinc ribbon domain-containing protein [Clostridia bacterium]|nr:C4-type zinc ribbon domain-containing protein [Clostridia bacterium]